MMKKVVETIKTPRGTILKYSDGSQEELEGIYATLSGSDDDNDESKENDNDSDDEDLMAEVRSSARK